MVGFLIKIVANGQFVQGESEEEGFEGWVEVLAYDWGGTRARVSEQGAGAQGRLTYQNLVIRKRVDTATPLLFKAIDFNEKCEVTLQLRKTGTGGKPENYMKITLRGAFITEIKQGNLSLGGEVPEENISFSYQEIEINYDAQDKVSGITRGGILHQSRMYQSG